MIFHSIESEIDTEIGKASCKTTSAEESAKTFDASLECIESGRRTTGSPQSLLILAGADDSRAFYFVLHVGGICLFLFACSCAQIGAAEVYSNGENNGFSEYRVTFVTLMFLIKTLIGKCIKRTLELNSSLYNKMTAKVQQRAVGALDLFVWAFYFVPITVQLCNWIFTTLDKPQKFFYLQYGPYVENFLFFGMLEQMYELITRHPDPFLYMHHFVVFFLGIFLIDGLPIDLKSSGIVLGCIQSAFDKFTYIAIFLSYFTKQRSIELLNSAVAAEDAENDDSVSLTLEGADVLWPSGEGLKILYRVAFFYYAVCVRVALSVSILVYCAYTWDALVSIWRVLLPMTAFFFYWVDFPTYVLLWKRSL